MRVLRCRAAYRDFVLAEFEKILDKVEQDAALRADDDERLRKWAPVPKGQIDRRRTGVLTIVVGVEDQARPQLELEPAAEKSA